MAHMECVHGGSLQMERVIGSSWECGKRKKRAIFVAIIVMEDHTLPIALKLVYCRYSRVHKLSGLVTYAQLMRH